MEPRKEEEELVPLKISQIAIYPSWQWK
jgi:hypothetical protein